MQELADRAGRRAERDEHQREAEDEEDRREEDLRRAGRATAAAPSPVPRISSSVTPEMNDR